ncbi:uncharacterized protein LOC118824856 [Colossoma macropomum]|uniref:uncharacterized protein LOC118824856 n=1 Tax=Colossoma macropomum TaxID=42526 RepID=UPI001863C5F3|nr:uncharacterized protein LOC118824856 [Colossoma macropomum]
MGWEWKRLYLFSIGLILLGNTDGFSVQPKPSTSDWQPVGSVVSKNQPRPPPQNHFNFDTARTQPSELPSTNTASGKSGWAEFDPKIHMSTSKSQIAQHGAVSVQTSGAGKPVLNVQNQYGQPLMRQGSYRTPPSRPYWYASNNWKPVNCGHLASRYPARNQDVPRPVAKSQSSENELMSTYNQNSYGAQLSGASRWYTLEGRQTPSSYQSTPNQPNKPMPQSSWSLANQYSATSLNQGTYRDQPTVPSSQYSSSGRLSVPSPPKSQSKPSDYILGSLTQPANQLMTLSQTSGASPVVSLGQSRYGAQSTAASGSYNVQASSQYTFSRGQSTPSFSQSRDTLTQVQSQPLSKPMIPTESLGTKYMSSIPTSSGAKWYRVDPLRLQVLQLSH